MKYLLLFFGIFAISISVCAQPTYNYQNRFLVKSGHVEYQLSGLITGTKSLWWDDFGEKYREEINSSETVKKGKRSEVVNNHSLSIFDGTYYYNIDLITMEGTKIDKNAVPDFSLLGSGLNDNEMEELGQGLLNAFGGKVDKESENILGRTCDVTKMMGTTVHVYKGVTLRSYVKIKSQENIEEAVRFDEDISVPASLFAPPANITLENVSSEMDGDNSFTEEPEEPQDYSFPTGIDFEWFRNESESLRRKLNYSFAMHDASEGEYSSIWMKDVNNAVYILAGSLTDNSGWREDLAGVEVDYFTSNGNPMAFYNESMYDEETGELKPASILLAELDSEDALIRIICMPQQTKEKLMEIFNGFSF